MSLGSSGIEKAGVLSQTNGYYFNNVTTAEYQFEMLMSFDLWDAEKESSNYTNCMQNKLCAPIRYPSENLNVFSSFLCPEEMTWPQKRSFCLHMHATHQETTLFLK